ncbi:MAG: addiction module protein [Halothiobacillus sp.]|jgi:putative addiction module component (TIGR02574 family)|nr:addiction module protein [Halothiobacillus sp.]
MNSNLKQLPIDERIRLVEDLWDSIAVDQSAIPLSSDQIAELDRRLDAYEADGDSGRAAIDVISELRKRL